ncbi:LOW QUALITY PROTEIN: hypothetical protein MAR_010822 [Mya arenaria]|uniref:Uncharacterized protein n=1 Tax=Mya arenaria TaxID=6604 RepID=A0ABY7FW77_MYAAR|nr:LOW QUALITY PROTEIN: hypothetical protein MAR_010822 [Mya arenaria]
MPVTKRKTSFRTPYERPSKMSNRSQLPCYLYRIPFHPPRKSKPPFLRNRAALAIGHTTGKAKTSPRARKKTLREATKGNGKAAETKRAANGATKAAAKAFRKRKGVLLKQAKIAKKTKVKKSKKIEKVQKRETLPDSCMSKGPLRGLTWSNWIKVVVPFVPNRVKSKYTKCRTNSVPGRGAGKKYVVYNRVTLRGFSRSGTWCTNLLHQANIRQEVSRVNNNGCTLFVRRGVAKGNTIGVQYKKMDAASDYIRDHFDYAWRKYI